MSSDDIYICPSMIRNERPRDSGRLEVTLLRKRKSSRLGRVSGLSRGLKEERTEFIYLCAPLPSLSLSLPLYNRVPTFPPALFPSPVPLPPSSVLPFRVGNVFKWQWRPTRHQTTRPRMLTPSSCISSSGNTEVELFP